MNGVDAEKAGVGVVQSERKSERQPSNRGEVGTAEVDTAEVDTAEVTHNGASSTAIAATTPAVRSPSGTKGFFQKLFLGVAFATTATVSAVMGAGLMFMLPPSADNEAPKDVRQVVGSIFNQGFGYKITRPVNILVLGIDRFMDAPVSAPGDGLKEGATTAFSGRSDVMLLVGVNPADNTASILSIPRDTRVEIPGSGVAKVNHANMEGGAALAAQTISANFDGVPVDRYLRVSTDAFRELVDLLGGVEVYVPYPMQYEDVTQKLKIDLDEGWQTLNGDQAEQFARFRRDRLGDVGRVQRQQLLLQALKNRLASPAILPKLPQVLELMQKYVDTNLTLEEMLALVNFGLNVDQEQFRMVMLPGRFSTPDESIASYWIMNRAERSRVMRDFFQVGPTMTIDDLPEAPTRLRIAVQNATNDPKLGREVAQYLREQGFEDVYTVRDWPDWQSQTQIIVQRGDLQGAQALEAMLGLGQVVSASTGDLESDLTIRVGTDWQTRVQPNGDSTFEGFTN